MITRYFILKTGRTAKRTATVLIFTALFNILAAQPLCNLTVDASDLAFNEYEKLVYAASYSWGPIFTDVGEAVMEINRAKNGSNEYCITINAKTYKFYDHFFKVRDFYESRFTVPELRSVYFFRDITEGDYSIKNTYNFDWENNKINAVIQRNNQEKNVELQMENCTLDILTYFYYLRNLDFSNVYPNKLYTIAVALDTDVFNIKCRYLCKEEKKIKALKKKVRCLKFAVEVIAGSVFKGNESVTMWVSDDKNHIPLEIESPIIVGKVKARILRYENLKYPL